MKDPRYFSAKDLNQAARQLRQDAADAGIDIYQAPEWSKTALTPAKGDSLLIKVANSEFRKVDIRECRFLSEWSRMDESWKTQPSAAIFVSTRALSIDEIADILESGVRIYGFFGYSLVLYGRNVDLARLSENDYFFWMDEFQASYKSGFSCTSIDNEILELGYLGKFEKSCIEDLSRINVGLIRHFERDKRIQVKGSMEDLKSALGLPWVEFADCSRADFEGSVSETPIQTP